MSGRRHRAYVLPGCLILAGALLHGCGTGTPRPSANYSGVPAADALIKAQSWAEHARRLPDDDSRANAWMRCAMLAHDAMAAGQNGVELAAAAWATRCSRQYLQAIAREADLNLHPGHMLLDGHAIQVQFRHMPDSLGEHVHVELASRIEMQVLDGARHSQQGFGVPMVAAAPPCTHRAICALYPPEGVFRPATAWLEGMPDAAGVEQPVLVLQNPVEQPLHRVGTIDYLVAQDISAPYEQLLERSKLRRLGWWGLIGGQAIGRRAGLFLLDDYDPRKTPVVMIHGLGSSPLIWAPLSNAIMGDADLQRRYQIWHVVYQSNAALLIERQRVQGYLDMAWKILDPGGSAPARQGVVLVGHSMGGVIARLLCAQSTPALWSAAFTVPFGSLHGRADDLSMLKNLFEFKPYPGVDELIFMASPQHGSPVAGDWFGRLAQDLAWRHIPEMAKLQRISEANPGAVQASLISGTYRISHLSSVTSLMPDEPVSAVDQTLMPALGVRYHTIAGSIARAHPPGDGYVPLSSAVLPGAASTLIVDADHHGVPRDPKAIAAVLSILRRHDVATASRSP